MSESVTVLRKVGGEFNAHGNTVFSETEIVFQNVLVALKSSGVTDELGRTPLDTSLTLYFPPGSALQANDDFLIRGERWVAESSPFEWVSPFAAPVGVVVEVRKRDG